MLIEGKESCWHVSLLSVHTHLPERVTVTARNNPIMSSVFAIFTSLIC